MRILYVEDNPANVFLVKRVARMGKHEVINYIDGGQALKKFDDIKPDLILMDIQLAGDIGGLDVVRELRAKGVKTSIIAVTAYAMVGDKERCLDAGCDDYLAKPLPIAQLVKIFEEYSARAITASKAKQTAVTTPSEEKTDISSPSDAPSSQTDATIQVTEDKQAVAVEATTSENDIKDSSSSDEDVSASQQAEADIPKNLSESSDSS